MAVSKARKGDGNLAWKIYLFFFFCNLFYFFFFYNALHYLQNIVYNICITLLTIHTYTYNNLVFLFFFLHVYITLNYLQNTYSRFEKKKKKIIINNSHFHTRAYAYTTYTHARSHTNATTPYTTDPGVGVFKPTAYN